MKIMRKNSRVLCSLFGLVIFFAIANSTPGRSDTELDNWKEQLKIEAIKKGTASSIICALDTFNWRRELTNFL